MSTKESFNNNIAIHYLGAALIIVIVLFGIYAISTQGYNTYFKWSQKEIEVQATNSNSQNKTIIE